MTFLYKLMGKAVLAVRINAVEFGEQKIINGNFDDYFKIKLLVFWAIKSKRYQSNVKIEGGLIGW